MRGPIICNWFVLLETFLPFNFPEFSLSFSQITSDPIWSKTSKFSSRLVYYFVGEEINLNNINGGEIDLNSGVGISLNGGAVVVLSDDGEISSTLSLCSSSSLEIWFPTLPKLSEENPLSVVSFFSTNFLTSLGISLRRFFTVRIFFSLWMSSSSLDF